MYHFKAKTRTLPHSNNFHLSSFVTKSNNFDAAGGPRPHLAKGKKSRTEQKSRTIFLKGNMKKHNKQLILHAFYKCEFC